jgi:hypothetical protein
VEIIKVKRLKAQEIIDEQNGKFFTATFRGKNDGIIHNLNGRTGVHKYIKKQLESHKENLPDLITAFNVKKMSYRRVFLDGILEIRAGGKIYCFE